MSSLRSVIITLPKGIQKTPIISSKNDLIKSTNNVNFSTSILSTTKPKAEDEKMQSCGIKDTQSELNKPDGWLRGKKRRLDHLTWEEKLQRKKLKNRVAAQTSRDRKKAKLDELEDTVRVLTDRNTFLTQECAMLRAQNEALIQETKKLKGQREENSTEERVCSMCRGRVGCVASSLGSAVSPNPLPQGGATQLALSLTPTASRDSVEDLDSLPPLEELFGDIQSDGYIERLEELAESLLREVTSEVEAYSNKSNEQKSIKKDSFEEFNDPKRVVGKTSKDVETSATSRSLNPCQGSNAVSQHTTSSTNPTGSFKSEIEVKQEPIVNDLDTVYGTYDEATNCITIIYPGEDDGVRIQECVQEIISEDNLTPSYSYKDHLSPAYTLADSMSPSSFHSDDSDVSSYKFESNLSDCGYESHDSIQTSKSTSTPALTDLWHESFSELFPSLA
ncbi:LOW QUALITY PROTEIN: uncharacterized protein Xbp1 [Chelonus insularis]|uniref:LOW QUALITY PROTEIN: uncharacterized protein Xbp1 n=1 Tax=Chelonus insularis TaxID=460826 RepID=UPI0015895533|nr:LOW QUALITY PROTEIN: uncharacterized protein LOC118072938 [Chelonus insularis]